MQPQQTESSKAPNISLEDQYKNPNLTLNQLLPQANFSARSEQIKKNMNDFITYCKTNKKLIQEMIDRGVKTDTFASLYQKNIALFSVEALNGDLGQSYKLFIDDDDQENSLRRTSGVKNQSQIEEQIQADLGLTEEQFDQKYFNLTYMLEYIRRPISQTSPVCINYLTKIMTNIISSKPWDVYAYFSIELNPKFTSSLETSEKINRIKQKEGEKRKTSFQCFVQNVKIFGGISEMLGKMIAEEGSTNQFLKLKKQIIESILNELKSQQRIKSSPDSYQYILDFVSYVFSRNKYKSEDNTQQLGKITQRFVDEDVVWFFKDKAIKAVIDYNALLNNNSINNSGTLNRDGSNRLIRTSSDNIIESQETIVLENTFQNAVGYLKILVQRFNSDQQIDSYMNQSLKMPQPTMDFQVNEALYGETSLLELMTLPVPFRYKSTNKMTYYEVLLKMTRNSRCRKADPQNQLGLPPSSLVPILTHLLKTFRRQYRNNGLVNFYIQELLTEAILPRIEKLDSKEAMMVLSAMNPSQEVLTKYEDSKVFSQKILIILLDKCEWFGQHFSKLGVNLKDIKDRYKTKLGGNSNIFEDRENKVKQFEFLFDGDEKNESAMKKSERVDRSQKIEDQYKSSSSDQEEEKDLSQFKPRRQFQFPAEKPQFRWGEVTQKIEKQKKEREREVDLFKSTDSQIVQQINVQSLGQHQSSEMKMGSMNKGRKQSEDVVLLVDSAGQQQENQVIREDMKQEPSSKP